MSSVHGSRVCGGLGTLRVAATALYQLIPFTNRVIAQLTKRSIRRGLRLFGLDVHRYAQTLTAVRARILSELAIDLVLDVGANRGQYARELRATGYEGRIISFEPLANALADLSATLARGPLWEGLEVALGDEDGRVDP